MPLICPARPPWAVAGEYVAAARASAAESLHVAQAVVCLCQGHRSEPFERIRTVMTADASPSAVDMSQRLQLRQLRTHAQKVCGHAHFIGSATLSQTPLSRAPHLTSAMLRLPRYWARRCCAMVLRSKPERNACCWGWQAAAGTRRGACGTSGGQLARDRAAVGRQ